MSSTTDGPRPLRALRSLLHAATRRRPNPRGTEGCDHSAFRPVLEGLAAAGIGALPAARARLAAYRAALSAVDPDSLSRPEALAFWLNLYNAEVLELVCEVREAGIESVWRKPGAFDRPRVQIAGESLSLDDIEHGKIRRFKDPRVHAALVCASVSCPTLSAIPYTGDALDRHLDRRMRTFLAAGGAAADVQDRILWLSRIFLWYGGDFVRPDRMPSWRPAPRRSVAHALVPWLPEDLAAWVTSERPRVEFAPYDWSLGCAVR